MEDLDLRAVIHGRIVRTGMPPSRDDIVDAVGSAADADARLQRLHDAHMIVLGDRPHPVGEIRMALPFAAEPTGYRVTTATGAWLANCAWDSLAVVAAMHDDGRIESTWSDTDEPVDIRITDGDPDHSDGYVHFRVPARHWSDDIART